MAEPWVLRKIGVIPLEAALATLAAGGVWDDPSRRISARGAMAPLRSAGSRELIGSLYLRWNTPADGQATVWRVERAGWSEETLARGQAPRPAAPPAARLERFGEGAPPNGTASPASGSERVPAD